jgi:hypothetical protein
MTKVREGGHRTRQYTKDEVSDAIQGKVDKGVSVCNSQKLTMYVLIIYQQLAKLPKNI